MAAYLYHISKLYLNEQKNILKKIEKEKKEQKIILESFKNYPSNTNITKKTNLDSNKNCLKIIESDSEVETSEEN